MKTLKEAIDSAMEYIPNFVLLVRHLEASSAAELREHLCHAKSRQRRWKAVALLLEHECQARIRAKGGPLK